MRPLHSFGLSSAPQASGETPWLRTAVSLHLCSVWARVLGGKTPSHGNGCWGPHHPHPSDIRGLSPTDHPYSAGQSPSHSGGQKGQPSFLCARLCVGLGTELQFPCGTDWNASVVPSTETSLVFRYLEVNDVTKTWYGCWWLAMTLADKGRRRVLKRQTGFIHWLQFKSISFATFTRRLHSYTQLLSRATFLLLLLSALAPRWCMHLCWPLAATHTHWLTLYSYTWRHIPQ